MTLLAVLLGLALIAGGLWDAFETVILPRRVVRQLRISSIFYRLTWRPYAFFASRIHSDSRREPYLSFYGPLSLLLHDWELWVADLLESHLSYPTLAYFRSQHENQSWVAGLAVILDVSAFVLACGVSQASRQAGFTLAVARHAVADLSNIFGERPRVPTTQRLTPETTQRLWDAAKARGLLNDSTDTAQERLTALRGVYEPYLEALADYLLMPLPPWAPPPGATDNWA